MREPVGRCAVCRLSGFPEASMSITEAGNNCQSCYFKWEQAQRQQAIEAERQAKLAVHKSIRFRLLAVVVFAIIVVIATNWRNCGR